MKILREKEVKTSRAHSCIRCDKRIEPGSMAFMQAVVSEADASLHCLLAYRMPGTVPDL